MGAQILVVTAGLLFFMVALIYNGLVRARTRVHDAWAGVDTELQRRHDLVARLTAVARAYLAHERQVLEEVTARRAAAVAADRDPGRGPADQAQVERALEEAVGRLLLLRERYPDLRADQIFLEVQQQLSETEDRLNFVRRFYNDRVARYEARRTTLPGLLVARPFGFGAAKMFAPDTPEVRAAPGIGT